MTGWAAVAALAFSAIHLFIGRLQFLDVVPRSRWLSGAGGVAVAYVFLHILPELAAHRETLVAAFGVGSLAAEMRVYLVALGGLVTFYGLERAANVSRHRSRQQSGEDAVESRLYWIHIGAFALYNLIIGYLLVHREETGAWSLLTFSVAMALHFVTADFGLRQHHKGRYDHSGRWILTAAVILGWLLAVVTPVPELVLALLFAFLAGGVVLNVLKEELPDERESRFWPFLAGAGAYAALLLAL
jgi:zinc transporter ZupT